MCNQVWGFHRGVRKFIAKIQMTWFKFQIVWYWCVFAFILISKPSDITIHMSDPNSKSSNILSDASLTEILKAWPTFVYFKPIGYFPSLRYSRSCVQQMHDTKWRRYRQSELYSKSGLWIPGRHLRRVDRHCRRWRQHCERGHPPIWTWNLVTVQRGATECGVQVDWYENREREITRFGTKEESSAYVDGERFVLGLYVRGEIAVELWHVDEAGRFEICILRTHRTVASHQKFVSPPLPQTSSTAPTYFCMF